MMTYDQYCILVISVCQDLFGAAAEFLPALAFLHARQIKEATMVLAALLRERR